MYGRKMEEYVADFSLVSRRALDDSEYRLFRFHYLLGADSRLCCRRFKMQQSGFYSAVYRIEKRLGRLFAELEPYPLYPLDEYFGGCTRSGPVRSSTPDPASVDALRGAVPLLLSA
ncbi:MAG TPA: hypothetical protein VLW65_01120 [Bryobacteraceae bacterium]|nr:hypothetical protein [Bryobacteraceae bacterium]